MIKICKEVIDLLRFFWFTKKSHKSIVFYSEGKNYYSNFEGIINELVNNQKKQICYITSDYSDQILFENNNSIKTFYSNAFLVLLMQLLDCEVLIMTLTDLNQFHIKKSYNNVHYVYVFHSMVSTHMMYREGAFDYYDSILCTGKYQVDEIRKREAILNQEQKSLINTGYYRLERINKKFLKKKTPESEKKTILIAPSWGEDNLLESCGSLLIKLLLKWNYNVIVRPHPEIFKHNPELINRLIEKNSNEKNFLIEKSIVNDDSLLKSDLLICDCSGIALEYAFGTLRPVLFLDVPIKIKNKNYTDLNIEPFEIYSRSIIGKICSTDDLASLNVEIESLIQSKKYFEKEILNLRDDNVFSFGSSSQIGGKYISSLLKTDEVMK